MRHVDLGHVCIHRGSPNGRTSTTIACGSTGCERPPQSCTPLLTLTHPSVQVILPQAKQLANGFCARLWDVDDADIARQAGGDGRRRVSVRLAGSHQRALAVAWTLG
eukprot:CAMPEP_0183356262 /NCGR_PEP_ID=MMETSP0164_2-20130417/43772_1 /TAXON_ID=221442 /ORGANISM="Coccolithus pelagicus ssp braarudi, Strain PLY182g" /LENGTH=106 /DNA_ID=CAMNT_0025529617 /DNA_START=662 /DNA_END=980 /DNA_ORIENTATION=-